MKETLAKVVGVLLEYGMLFWLLYFVGKLALILKNDIIALRGQVEKEAAPNEAVLTCVAGNPDFLGRRFAFRNKISIGRGEENDIVIPETFVSNYHAVISLRGNLYVIEDLNSANSTFVNDYRLEGKAYLKTGDYIRIGTVVFELGR